MPSTTRRPHRPTKYNVITPGGVTYGWRCALCGIPSKRFVSEENRDKTLAAHLAE